MAYRVTVYFNDEYIASTRIYGVNGNVDITKAYGSAEYSATGFYDTTAFTANPASGCEFKYWVYRVGSVTADQQYSYANPFRYSGTEDIYIRAIGQTTSGGGSGGDVGGNGTWTLVNKGSLGTITTQQDISLTIKSYEVYRYAVKFEYSGYATFYTSGNVDTYGQYSETASFDSSTGEADPFIKRNNDGSDGSNFYIKSNTVTAGTTYYVWVSGSSGSDTGQTTLHIVPPSKPTTDTMEKWSWNASNGSASATQTSNAYNAIVNRKATTNFSHIVWNDMVDKVKELTENSSGYWDTSYASYANTKMNSSPYKLTATIFNSLRNNLEVVGDSLSLGYRTDIGKVEPGERVKGDYFLTLAGYINACIDKL